MEKIEVNIIMKDKNISKISISSRKLNMIKAFKILELLNINNMIMYIDDEYDYTKERDILISNHIVKDNWRFYINMFTDEIFSGILSSDTDCILEIDDYEKIVNVRFRKDKYNRKNLVNSLKEILR